MQMNAQRRGEERDVEWKAPLGTTWGESRSSAATQRAVMIRKSLKRIVGIGQLLIGYSQETKPTPPSLPPSPSPRLPFTWSGYHANQHWTVSPFPPLSSPPSTPLLLSPSLPPSSPTSPNLPPPPPPPPQPTDPTPAALLLEKGPILWLQIEHGPAVDFHRSVIMITHIVSRRCGYCRCGAKRTWKQNVFLMSQAKKMLPEKW